jgi:hypothetical protein
VQLDIARVHIARELALLREQGFNLAADESVTSSPSSAASISASVLGRGAMQSKNICDVRSLTQCSRK